MRGIAGRLAIFSSLIALVATVTVGYMVYRGARDLLIQHSFDRVAHTAETVRVRTWANLGAIADDVRFLAKTPPVQGIVRARMQRGFDPEWSMYGDEWGVQLAEIFRSFLESRSSYFQVRFISVMEGGRELVRVDRRDGRAVFADVRDLTREESAPYVQSTAELEPGGVFLSDIRTSDGSKGIPAATPVLYVGTPIHSASGRIFGVLIVTVDIKDVLAPLGSLIDSNQTLYVSNSRGRVLYFSRRHASDSDPPAPDRLHHIFPAVQELMIGTPSEMRMLDARLSTGVPGVAYFESISLDADSGRSSLVIGVTEPHESILSGVRSVRDRSALITLLLCVAAIGVALAASRYLTKPLRHITGAVASFGEGRDRPSLPVDRTDEIGQLARSFEAMEHQIQNQIRALEDEGRRQRTIFETSAEGIIVTDKDGRIEAFNPAAEQIFGYAAHEVRNRPAHLIVASDVVELSSRREPGSRPSGVESVGVRADGEHVPLFMIWSTFEWGGEQKFTIFVQDVHERKEAEEARERLVREIESERETLRELSATLELRVRERTSDLERLNRELDVSNRELREIANVASHDLQEPLRKLRSFADLLESEHGDRLDEEGRFYAKRIFELSERMSHLINDLLAFSRVTFKAKPYERVALNDVAQEVVAELRTPIQEAGGTVRVEWLPEVEADPSQMKELFEHLIANALTHRRSDAAPFVRVRGSLQDEHLDGSDGAVCVLEFEDNGIGFDQRYAGRIFAPFERLHGRSTPRKKSSSARTGTGMGLTICRRIVENHRGTITARSAPGSGSTFIVTLPVRQPSAAG